MSNNLQYVFSLMDKLSAPMRSIAVTSDKALDVLSKLEKQQHEVQRSTNAFGNSISTLRSKIELLRNERDIINPQNLSAIRQYNREIQSLEKRVSSLSGSGGMKGMMGDALNSLPMGGFLMNPIVMAGGAFAKAISTGIKNENLSASMSSLLGSKGAGDAMTKDVKAYGMTSPYESIGLAENAKMMLGFGIAQEKIMPTMKMLGDVAMGSQDKLNLLTLAFSQVQAAGKLQGQDLLQLINAGFNPLQTISEMTGKSMAVLRDDMSKGAISADMVTAAFQKATGEGGRYHDMANKMGMTLGGRLSTALDNVNILFGSLYNMISPVLIPAVNLFIFAISGLNDLLVNHGDLLAILGVVLGGLTLLYNAQNIALNALIAKEWLFNLSTKATALWTEILAIKTALLTNATWLLNAALSANPFFWIPVAIGAAVTAVVLLWNKFEGFRQFLYSMWESVKTIFTNIGSFIKGIFSPIADIISAVKEGRWGDVAKAGAKLIYNLSPVGMAVNTIDFAATGGFTKGLSQSWAKGQALGSASWKASQSKSKVADNPMMAASAMPINPAATTNIPSNSTSSTGTKSTVINITVGSLVNEIKIMGNDLGAMQKEIEDAVLNALARTITISQSQLGAQ